MSIRAFTTTRSELSMTYSASDSHRAHAGDRIRWITAPSRATCDECFALQHENRGGDRTRGHARTRRAIRGGPDLFLCTIHADLWRTRDSEDLKGTHHDHH